MMKLSNGIIKPPIRAMLVLKAASVIVITMVGV